MSVCSSLLQAGAESRLTGGTGVDATMIRGIYTIVYVSVYIQLCGIYIQYIQFCVYTSHTLGWVRCGRLPQQQFMVFIQLYVYLFIYKCVLYCVLCI